MECSCCRNFVEVGFDFSKGIVKTTYGLDNTQQFELLGWGPSIKDIRSKLGLFDPLPPCPSYDVTVTTQVSLLCPLWADPPSPYLGRPLWMLPKQN